MKGNERFRNSVAAGNQEPWKKYIAVDALYFDEKGTHQRRRRVEETKRNVVHLEQS